MERAGEVIRGRHSHFDRLRERLEKIGIMLPDAYGTKGRAGNPNQ
jgi:hypothetical protein